MKYKVGSELCQNWEAKPWSKGKDFICNEVEHVVSVCVMESFALNCAEAGDMLLARGIA